MKIKTITLLGLLLTLSIFTMASCVADTKDPLPPSDVSAANCADATAALNCFISKWDTTKTGDGASATNVVELPLVENGAYNFYVDWGDGTRIENITEYDTSKDAHTHEYEKSGEYTIHIAGEIKGWRFFVSVIDASVSEATFDDYGDAVKLLDVSQWGSLSLGNTDGRQFYTAENFNPTASDAPSLSETTSLAAAFQGATIFDGAIGNWDVSTITTMVGMFRDAKAFDRDLKSWGQKTKNVTSMASMFQGARLFDQDISGWNVSAVTDMSYMFEFASAFDQDLSDWDVSAVTTMETMFWVARTFNSPLLWGDKTRNVTNMASMFEDATLFDKDLSGWNVCNVTRRGLFDSGTPTTWTAEEKPNWGMDCPTN